MKTLLYILLILQIISGAFGFFMFIASAWYIALICLFLYLLQVVLTLAVIDNKNRIENLELNVDNIFYKLKKYENTNDIIFNDDKSVTPIVENRHASIGPWECIKCGTINKTSSTHCSNCKADYSPLLNPTVNPNDKKKRVSRWIKYK